MDNNQSQSSVFNNANPQPLPNSTAVLILGVVSLLACCCYALPGIICSIIALVLAAKDLRLYRAHPEAYTRGSYSNLTGGRICAIIALVFSIVFLIMFLWTISIVGLQNMRDPDQVRAIIQQHFK